MTKRRRRLCWFDANDGLFHWWRVLWNYESFEHSDSVDLPTPADVARLGYQNHLNWSYKMND